MGKIEAKMTIGAFGIIKGAKYGNEDGFSDQTQASLVKEGIAIYIQDDELMQSEVDDWQEKPYPNNFLVLKNGNMYRAEVGDGNFTSSAWVDPEWSIRIKGAQ